MTAKKRVALALFVAAMSAASLVQAEPRCYKNPNYGPELRSWLLSGGPLSGQPAPKPAYCTP